MDDADFDFAALLVPAVAEVDLEEVDENKERREQVEKVAEADLNQSVENIYRARRQSPLTRGAPGVTKAAVAQRVRRVKELQDTLRREERAFQKKKRVILMQMAAAPSTEQMELLLSADEDLASRNSLAHEFMTVTGRFKDASSICPTPDEWRTYFKDGVLPDHFVVSDRRRKRRDDENGGGENESAKRRKVIVCETDDEDEDEDEDYNPKAEAEPEVEEKEPEKPKRKLKAKSKSKTKKAKKAKAKADAEEKEAEAEASDGTIGSLNERMSAL